MEYTRIIKSSKAKLPDTTKSTALDKKKQEALAKLDKIKKYQKMKFRTKKNLDVACGPAEEIVISSLNNTKAENLRTPNTEVK